MKSPTRISKTRKSRYAVALVAAFGLSGLCGMSAEAVVAVPKRPSLEPASIRSTDLPKGWERADEESEDELYEEEPSEGEPAEPCEFALDRSNAIGQLIHSYSAPTATAVATSTTTLFSSGRAATTFRAAKDMIAQCKEPGFTVSTSPKLGDESLRITSTDPAFGISFDNLVVRKGDVVVAISVVWNSKTKAPVTTALAKKIVPRMSKAK
jgi:hypothetical protein